METDGQRSKQDCFSLSEKMSTVLWQFTLELLIDKKFANVVQWLNDEGQFKILQPHIMAYLWGVRKGKPNMDYTKMARAYRYYYESGEMSKVVGTKFAYQFEIEIEPLLGYSYKRLREISTKQRIVPISCVELLRNGNEYADNIEIL